jgi:hypothetical protein
MKAKEIAKDIIVETLDLSIKSFSEIGVSDVETKENTDNATEKIEQYKNKCVIEVLEKLEVKHRMSLDYNLIGEIGDIIKELKQ